MNNYIISIFWINWLMQIKCSCVTIVSEPAGSPINSQTNMERNIWPKLHKYGLTHWDLRAMEDKSLHVKLNHCTLGLIFYKRHHKYLGLPGNGLVLIW